MLGSSFRTNQTRPLLGRLTAAATAIHRYGHIQQRERTAGVQTLVTSAASSKAYYAVAVGRVPGVYSQWEGENGVHAQVNGYPGAKYKGFNTMGGECGSVHY